MWAHLRFNSMTGKVEHKTSHGKHTEELLQLNDEATVQYRLSTLRIVHLFSSEIEKLEQQVREIDDLLRKHKISKNQYDTDMSEINQEITELRFTIHAQTGELPLPPLQKQRQGVPLLSSS